MIAKLQAGDYVAIAATARKVSAAEMAPAIAILSNWGLQVVLADDLYAADNQYAGSDHHRSQAFQKLLDDPKIKAIFCARGGYGTVRMIDQLDFTQFCKTPKWIIGYSDITVLHAHIEKNFGIPTLHAPMPINWQADKLHQESLDFLKDNLFAGPQTISFAPHPLNTNLQEIKGSLIGGNLSVLYAILGSNSDQNYSDKILFLEDLDEYLYHIDRMLIALKRAGKLAKLKGIVIGQMSDMKDNAVPFGKTAEEIILEAVKEYNYPVVFGIPAGHEARNLSLILGSNYQLKIGASLQLVPEN